MKATLNFFRQFYRLCLRLFPQKYRKEYAEELEIIFQLSLEDAAQAGKLEIVLFMIRELGSLPKAIAYEHLREWSNAEMTRKFEAYFNFSYGSWKEFLTALLPFFVVVGVSPAINLLGRQKLISVPSVATNAIMLGLLPVFLILFIVGLMNGLPRWSLPYLGFVLSLFSVYLLSTLIGLWISFILPSFFRQPSLLADIVGNGLFWLGLLSITVLFVVVIRNSSKFQRFRDDWTLLCFMLYGAIPFALLLYFDDYTGDEPYTLLAFVVLACGTWFYLHIQNEWKRFGILFAAMTLAVSIALVGKVIITPVQDWPFQVEPYYWKSDVQNTIFTWLWLALTMLSPIAIKVLPPFEDTYDEGDVAT